MALPMAKVIMSMRLDERLLRTAQQLLGAKSKTEAIELSLKAIIETDNHRKLIKRFSGKAPPGDFDHS